MVDQKKESRNISSLYNCALEQEGSDLGSNLTVKEYENENENVELPAYIHLKFFSKEFNDMTQTDGIYQGLSSLEQSFPSNYTNTNEDQPINIALTPTLNCNRFISLGQTSDNLTQAFAMTQADER